MSWKVTVKRYLEASKVRKDDLLVFTDAERTFM